MSAITRGYHIFPLELLLIVTFLFAICCVLWHGHQPVVRPNCWHHSEYRTWCMNYNPIKWPVIVSFPTKMLIFHSYLSLPEGINLHVLVVFQGFSHFPMVFPWFSYGYWTYLPRLGAAASQVLEGSVDQSEQAFLTEEQIKDGFCALAGWNHQIQRDWKQEHVRGYIHICVYQL